MEVCNVGADQYPLKTVAHGMIGTVVMASDNTLAQEFQKEFGLPLRDF